MMPINIWPPIVAVEIITATFSAGLRVILHHWIEVPIFVYHHVSQRYFGTL